MPTETTTSKKAKKILLFSMGLLFLSTSHLFSQPFIQDFPDFSTEEIEQLTEGRLLTSDTTIYDGLRYSPSMLKEPVSSQKNKDAKEQDESGFTVEALSLIPLPNTLQGQSIDEILIYLINTLRSVSTQEGITYISHRRGEVPYPLFTKSYHVVEKGKRSALPDPVITEIPSKIEDIVYQKDTSFSGNYYQHTYSVYQNMIFLTVENLSTLSVFGIIPAVPKNTLQINFFIGIYDEGIICYTQADIADRKPILSILGFEVHLPSAFQRRITSLQEWLSEQLSS